MPISNLLYDRPDLDQDRGLLPLYITGVLPDYVVREAYEGRLQIHNAVGACQVVQIAGDTLPAGHQIWVDNETQEIVVAWPPYSEGVSELENAGFESGDINGWTVTITGERDGYSASATASSDRPNSGGYSAFWNGNRGYGHAGGVEAVWVNDTRASVYPMQRVTASAAVALDDTGQSQNRGQVRLHWYDQDNNLVQVDSGILIRGNQDAYRGSTVSGVAPFSAVSCALAVWTTANYSGGVRFDDAVWDAPTVIGTTESRRYCITLRVRDSAGRTAYWSGCIGEVAIYLTSRPYATELIEAITPSAQPRNGWALGQQVESITTTCAPLSGTLRTPLVTYSALAEAITSSAQPLPGTLRSILATYTAQAEAITSTAAPLTGGTLKKVLVTYSGEVEAITTTCTPLGGTLA